MFHFIMDCKIYKIHRNKLFLRIEKITDMEKLLFPLGSDDIEVFTGHMIFDTLQGSSQALRLKKFHAQLSCA